MEEKARALMNAIYKEENIYRCYTSGLEVNQLLDNIKQFDREEK